MGTKYNPSAVRDGLLICVDPANLNSYSGSGITARGLVSGIGATLVNGIGFSSSIFCVWCYIFEYVIVWTIKSRIVCGA